MPKHAFKFPAEVVAAVKRHVRQAIEAVDPARYNQEANYTAALASRLEGVAYQGEYGIVEFQSTVFDDRGRGSAESRYGADFANTATISDGRTTIRKVILVQAKLGSLDDMSSADAEFLRSQLEKMKQLVDAPKAMEIPEQGSRRYPAMVSGNNILDGKPYTPMELPEYLRPELPRPWMAQPITKSSRQFKTAHFLGWMSPPSSFERVDMPVRY